MASRKKSRALEPTRALIRFELNGEPAEVAFAPHKTLLEVLREDLGLTGTKHGCELGECGTCAVLVDGEPVLSCLVLGLECEGRRVETVEGMAGPGGLHPLQKAFADLGAAQCGYCTPGFLLTAKALLEENPKPTLPRDPRSARGQPLPLHRLHQDLRSRRARRRLDARRRRAAPRSTDDSTMALRTDELSCDESP